MIRQSYILLLILLNCHIGPLTSEPIELNDREQLSQYDFLVTYPRSGTNLTLNILRAMGKGTRCIDDHEASPHSLNRIDVDLDPEKVTLIRCHQAAKLRKVDSTKSKLLLIVRNYKECIPRNLQAHYVQDKIKNQSEEEFINDGYQKALHSHYLKNLTCYENWTPSNRLLVYYEDIMVDPYEAFKKMAVFFDLDMKRFEAAMQDFDKYSNRTLASYHKQHEAHGGSRTKGKDLLYHSKNFSTDYLRKVDGYIQKRYPRLWERHLSRYRT